MIKKLRRARVKPVQESRVLVRTSGRYERARACHSLSLRAALLTVPRVVLRVRRCRHGCGCPGIPTHPRVQQHMCAHACMPGYLVLGDIQAVGTDVILSSRRVIGSMYYCCPLWTPTERLQQWLVASVLASAHERRGHRAVRGGSCRARPSRTAPCVVNAGADV